MQSESSASRLPEAVVAGVDVNGLGVVRSLAKAGVPTIALDTDLTKPTLATRFGKKVRVPALSGKAFVDALRRLAETLKSKPVLILTQEDSVATVSAERENLKEFFSFSMPGDAAMRMLMNKSAFQQRAEELSYPIPRSLRLSVDVSMSEMAGLRFPCVVKPLVKSDAYSTRFVKAYKVANAREADELWRNMRAVIDEAIMQEWIEGEDTDVYFCLQYRGLGGAAPISFAGRKICQWPPQVGGTASCIPAPEVADELLALTDGFFAAVGFVGLGSMEYKRDRRDRKFYMVEPTVGRTDYQEEVATLNGINIPLAAYCGEAGLPLPAVETTRPPRLWRDTPSYDKARRAGAPDAAGEIAPHARIVDTYFRADDPLPYILLELEPITRRVKRLFRRELL